jgi:very-short-patch-repair endonuclease
MSTARARSLRHNATGAERKLWEMLRQLRPQGFHFRRQVPIGPYYADFACHDAKLIIEIDGNQHGYDDEIVRDARRTAFLQSAGYRVVRYSNHDVLDNFDGVMIALHNELQAAPPHPQSLPTRRWEAQDRKPRSVFPSSLWGGVRGGGPSGSGEGK